MNWHIITIHLFKYKLNRHYIIMIYPPKKDSVLHRILVSRKKRRILINVADITLRYISFGGVREGIDNSN